MTQAVSGNGTRGAIPPPRRYLALFLPWLPAERALRAGIAPPDRPFALVEKQRGAMRIVALGSRAAALGLEPGLPLADARGRVPDLVAIPHDSAADGALLGRLARLCGDYTPAVEPDPPQGVMLDIGGCAHLFGGEEALTRALAGRIEALGVTVRTALAATPDAARALARWDAEEVGALPIAALAIGEETRTALHRAGFRAIGELAKLPRAALAARFGEALTTLLDRLLARQDPHISPHLPPERITAGLRFAEHIARTADVLKAIEDLTTQAATMLAGRGEGGRAFSVRLHRSDGHVARLTVETGAATRDSATVMRLIRERIDSLADPLDAGFGYDAIDLAVPLAEPLGEMQQDLEPRTRRKPDIGPLLDRLAVRYGRAAVLRFAQRDSHIPERAGALQPVAASAVDPSWPMPEEREPPLRPILLFDPPQPVEVIAAVPDGPPRRFQWRGKAYRIMRHEGPERIAAEWWRRKGGHADNPGLTRDYYRVEDEAGRRFWLFRHGLYEREAADPRWYVHGLFA